MKNPRQTQQTKNPRYQNPTITKQQQILHNSNMSKTKNKKTNSRQQNTQYNKTNTYAPKPIL